MAQDQLSGRFQAGQRGSVAGDELAFAMGHGQVHPLDTAKEDALFAGHSQADPAVFVLAGVVVGQRGRRAAAGDGSSSSKMPDLMIT